MNDVKEMWEAIKSKFGGNDESKKMQKYLLKQQFESFSVSISEGLHKGYDRFQSILSQLETHGAGVSTEDANQKFLRSLPSSWSQVSLIMRTKPGVDTLNLDDLYNNLRVFESDVKGSTGSSFSTLYMAFISSDNTSSTNEVNTAYGVSTSSGHNSQKEGSSSYTDDLMYFFFANQSSGLHMDHEDLKQGESCILMPRNLLALTRAKLSASIATIHDTLLESADQKGIKTVEGEMQETLDTRQGTMKRDLQNRMNIKLCSGSDTEVTSFLKVCEESYAKLNKLYDEQREQLGVASIEIQAYTLALKKVKAQLVCHQKNQLAYKEKIRSSDVEDSHVNDRFAKVEGMHVVPPPMTGNYMPPKFDFGIDESKFTYGLKQSTTSKSDAKTSDLDYCDSSSSEETLETVPKPVKSKPKVINDPKVWSDAPIIEEYESDSDDEYVSKALVEQKKPSCAFINIVKHVKTLRQTIQDQDTCSQNPKVDQRDWTSLKSKRMGLGYGYTKKACFVCGSFSYLIRDYDFHEKRMATQVELNKQKGTSTGPRENIPVWNNVQRLNHQNNFVPTAVLTKTGRFPVNAARQNFTSQATSTRTARKVNTDRPKVNEIRPRHNVYKSHLPIRRPFNKTTAPKANFAQHKVNTARDNSVSAVGGKWKTAVKASTGCNWRYKRHYWNRDNPHQTLKGKGIVDSGCFRNMTGNKAYLVDYQDFNGGPIAFGGSKGQITGKGKIKTGKLDFEDVYFVKELQHFNLFSLPNENKVLLRVPRQHNMYSFNLENIVPSGGLACLIAKATVDESTKWHRRFSWVFFLRTKDETSGILKDFIRQIENQLNQKVKTIRCDNGTEFKNMDIIEYCGSKEIMMEYSNARTLQQNGAEAVSTACYVLNRVLVTKPQNKTPYELLTSKIPIISYIRPCRCYVTILNTIDHLDKFEEKSDEGFLVGYSLSSKAFRPITAENKANKTAGPKETNNSAGAARASNTNYVNIASTPVNTAATTPLNTNQDDYQISSLEDIYLYKNRKDKRCVVVRNKARLVTQRHRQEERIDYDEGFAPVVRIEAIRIFLAFASYMGFIVYQMDVKSAFLYGKIDEEVYVSQPSGFIDPKFLNKVYKVIKALYGLHQAPRACYATLSTFLVQSGYKRGLIDKTLFIKKDKKDIMLVQVYVDDIIFGSTKKSWCDEFEALMKNRFQMSSMDELTFFLGLQVKQIEHGIFISQDKYVVEILKKFDFLSVKTASIPIKTKKPLVKDEEAADVDVTPKTLHLQAVKRIFRYLKGQPKLGLWYPRESTFDLEAYSDSDYARANLDRKSTTKGCQFLGRRLISWQCKKQTIIATSTTEEKYVAAASCCGQLKVNGARLKITTARVYVVEGQTVNDEVRIQALVDGKRVDIKESSIRRTLRLDDAEGTSCLTDIDIFEGLAKIGFVQLIINHQLGDMAHRKEIFDTHSLTKKVFANMKRVGTGFSGEVTLLFDNMLVQAPKEVDGLKTILYIPIATEPLTSKPQKKHKPKRKHTQESKVPPTQSLVEQNLPSPSNDPLPSGEDSLKLKELMDLCTNLSNKVLELESEVIDIKSTYQERIEKLEVRVERLEEENRVLKELKSVHSTDDATEPVMEKEKSSKQGRKIADIDADVLSMMDVNEEEPTDIEEVLEVVKAAKLMFEVVTNARATKTPFEKHYNFNQTFLDEVNKGVKVSETEVRQEKDVKIESSKREGESLKQEITKKQKIEEETEELKKHLQIVTDDDDDVYTDATPLASKIL
uniref:Putative ribonuclease H-like domain-containing protein n=1 Tax=Tanacetum cinerariifolium TaxID=118510 RepID=A0A6L2L191_TANCI|nr:putative ribonuclease H-like domain-containing protein [Tanacetum cinerariifolium]